LNLSINLQTDLWSVDTMPIRASTQKAALQTPPIRESIMRLARKAALASVALFLVTTPSFAQQNVPEIATNQLVEQMLRSPQNDGGIVEIRGYVGLSTPETVRLYSNLSLSSYSDIPRSAVVNTVPEGDPKLGPVKLFVRGSATIITSVRHSAALVPSSQRAEFLALMGTGNGSQVRSRSTSVCFGICASGLGGGGAGADLLCLLCLVDQSS
jgi:hypothetical protein